MTPSPVAGARIAIIGSNSFSGASFARHCLEQGIESWTLIPSLGPADPLVLEDGDDFPAGPLSDVEEDAALVLGRLLVR